MRHVQKGNAPGILTGDGANFQNAALQFAATGQTDANAYRSSLKKYAVYVGDNDDVFDHYGSGLFQKYSYYSDPAVKRQLIAEHHGKCAFCESFIMATDVGDVEHFRPKAAVTTRDPNDPRIEVAVPHPGYFWLSAHWANLYLSCKQCNQAFKKNFFDVWPADAPRMTPANRGVNEAHLLLSPARADNELRRLIRFNPETAEAMPNPENPYGVLPNRAQALPRIARTIEIVGLNRPRLVEARAHHLVKLRALFALVAGGGGLPADHAAPQVTDAAPAILDFVVPIDTAAADARLALERAVAPTAEFSALALDALIVWSALLQFRQIPVQVAQQQVNQIRLVQEPQRLNLSVELAEQRRVANAASSAEEAQPDTSDLDPQYNELLRRYKARIREIRRQRADLLARRQQVAQLQAQHQQIRTQNGLAEVEGDYQEALGAWRQLLFQAGGNEQLAQQNDVNNVRQTIANMEAQMAADPLARLIQEDNARRAVIEQVEKPLDKHYWALAEIYEDLVEVHEAYRIRGAPRATRGRRCEQLLAALGSMTNWLDSGAALSAAVQNHLQNRGFPPSIRL